MQPYLANSRYIDLHHPDIQAKATELSEGLTDPSIIVKTCFEFVRDEIKHSWDFKLNPITCKASDVLQQGTGYCYAKSHLLAALLRANGIPAGLCYQRLTIEGDKEPYCLHGLNAVYLKEHGWYRIDARGNKEGVNAQFRPPVETLAYPITHPGEADLPKIWIEPMPVIVDTLESRQTYLDIYQNLPDIELCSPLFNEECPPK